MIGLLLRAKDNHTVDVYTVHEGPEPPADRIDRAAALVFVRDGFSWGAALVPALYFLVRARWLALVAYLAAAAAFAALLKVAGVTEDWITVAIVAFNLLVGFEASSIERAMLALKGWREIATVSGRNRAECERRFFERWLEETPAILLRATESAARPHGLFSGFARLGA